jgi:2-polyprenyl-6-methoxyphenol hydroxylase-like FAD-dependent oxidoreductase
LANRATHDQFARVFLRRMKVVICGAGIAGLALANCLQRQGWEICIVEHARGPRTQGYMIDFIGAGYEAAEAIGVLPRLEQLAYPVDEVAYVDERGRRRARLSYGQFSRALNGRLVLTRSGGRLA